MLVAQVVVGLWAQGKKGLSACPMLPGEEEEEEFIQNLTRAGARFLTRWDQHAVAGDQYQRYDSLVDRIDSPSIFVVQHGSQALPSYLIEYH